MQNNMELGYEMFCYQCEQTANGKGCTRQGVCGLPQRWRMLLTRMSTVCHYP